MRRTEKQHKQVILHISEKTAAPTPVDPWFAELQKGSADQPHRDERVRHDECGRQEDREQHGWKLEQRFGKYSIPSVVSVLMGHLSGGGGWGRDRGVSKAARRT